MLVFPLRAHAECSGHQQPLGDTHSAATLPQPCAFSARPSCCCEPHPNRVQTTAKAMASCKSKDKNGYACISASASAFAWAESTVAAHAEAVASAVNACGCMTEAVAQSIGSADVYLKLVAEASSTATADVCIQGVLLQPILMFMTQLHTSCSRGPWHSRRRVSSTKVPMPSAVLACGAAAESVLARLPAEPNNVLCRERVRQRGRL